MSAKREKSASHFKRLRALGAFAGETPAVPANHLTFSRTVSHCLDIDLRSSYSFPS